MAILISLEMRIVYLNQTQLESVECFKYLGSMLTNDGRCTVKLNIGLQKLHLIIRRIFLPVHWIWS